MTMAQCGLIIRGRNHCHCPWLTHKLMATLFDVDIRTISEHLRNIFLSGELHEDSVIRKFRNTAADGKSYATKHYNLDAIISKPEFVICAGLTAFGLLSPPIGQ